MIGSKTDQNFFGTVLNLISLSASPGLIRTNPHFIRTCNRWLREIYAFWNLHRYVNSNKNNLFIYNATTTSGTGLFSGCENDWKIYWWLFKFPWHFLQCENLLQNVTTFLIRKSQFLYKEICHAWHAILDRRNCLQNLNNKFPNHFHRLKIVPCQKWTDW